MASIADRIDHAIEEDAQGSTACLEAAARGHVQEAEGRDRQSLPECRLEDTRRRLQAGGESVSRFLTGDALMREIDRSVLTWCSDFRPGDEVFHGAVLDPSTPTDEELALGWQNFYEMHGREPVALREVVFRRPTWEHVPARYGLRAAPSQGVAATGLPFQPFEHYRYTRHRAKCVLRSNWIGLVDSGRFRTPTDPQGRLTEELGRMIVMLVDRYGAKPNWSGYTHIDDMKAEARLALASQLLKFSPLKSSNPFAYATQTMKTSFIQSKNGLAEVWTRERHIGDAVIGEDGEGFAAADSETWNERSEREFNEGKAAFDDSD